jgi:hypothetical protein
VSTGRDLSLPQACVSARALFAGYLDETLSREERSSVREHIAGCAGCRRVASSDDPAFLFAGIREAEPEVTPAETAKILEAVRTGIQLKTAERRLREARARRRSWARPAMTAAAAVAAGVLAWRLSPRPESARIASVHGAAPATGANVRSAHSAAPVAESPARPASIAPSLPGGLEPAKTDAKGNVPGDATIYDWNPGGGQPRVVWIVDRSLDI